MDSREVQDRIDEYLDRVRELLPEVVERGEVIDELRVHINDALSDRREKRPSESSMMLLEEILVDLGSPREIASEYRKELPESAIWTSKRKRMLYMIGRFVVVVFVVFLASVFVSNRFPSINFPGFFLVLLFFTVIEWLIKLYQGGIFIFHEKEE
ncbi:MAG: hypothetical protein KGY80_05465 [Candidatus Thorarchaeota archaeon]|nr:hypothetical protein [Candidatus Thorarchaeota archaeon]